MADELIRLGQTDRFTAFQRDPQLTIHYLVGGGIDVRTALQGEGLVEEGTGERNDSSATHRIVSRPLAGAAVFGDGVGAIQGIVQ
ncbi:hypothetical protein D3C80_801490 [compost metagenome]